MELLKKLLKVTNVLHRLHIEAKLAIIIGLLGTVILYVIIGDRYGEQTHGGYLMGLTYATGIVWTGLVTLIVKRGIKEPAAGPAPYKACTRPKNLRPRLEDTAQHTFPLA